jgi:hypothetical protein
VQKYPDLVLNALTLYNCNCHGVGGTEKKEGTPNTEYELLLSYELRLFNT